VPVFMRKQRIKIVVFIPGCILKFRTLVTIRDIILSIVCSSLLCWLKRIVGSPTDKNEDLLHASFIIYGPIQNYYAFWSTFLNDKFSFTFPFHVVDTFYNSTSC
jgi:hypothetical protein